MNGLLVNGNEITADCGVGLASLCNFAKDNGLSGLEFAYGIPGSVGGAMVMNAGAYGGEMKDVVIRATAITADGEILTVEGNDMRLSYRNSIFKQKDYIVLSTTFSLKQDNAEDINSRMEDFMNRRKTKQPLEYPSAGSVFKRPVDNFAARMIDTAGLKGVSVGGAQVSEKHAGFIINRGGATAADVKALVRLVRDEVEKLYRYRLECEIQLVSDGLGDDGEW
jgi:UDP-N-acetylmuramate dehydrogenase